MPEQLNHLFQLAKCYLWKKKAKKDWENFHLEANSIIANKKLNKEVIIRREMNTLVSPSRVLQNDSSKQNLASFGQMSLT